jgi:hypothetical protein
MMALEGDQAEQMTPGFFSSSFIKCSRILASGSHDQYTTIVRSKLSQIVLNDPK